MSHLALAGPLFDTAGTFAVPHIRYLAILPEIVLLGGAVMILGLSSLVRRPLRVPVATASTVAVAGTALGLSIWQWTDVLDHGPSTAVAHAVVLDGFSAFVSILLSAAMVLSALVGDGFLRREGIEGPEYHVLALISTSGAMIMAEANDLVLIFLGLEILSIALYVLAAFNRKRAASGEAALKYFVLGAFSSAIFVYGIALTYGATGSTNLTQIADFLARNVVVTDGLLLAGLGLLLVGFSFKIAAVPFHMWTPDVYQGAPSPVTGFMAAVAKVGAFAALLRVFVSSFGVLRADWQPIVYALAVITLVVGAVMAVIQRDAKRMLAYSSINHAGFILLGLQAGTSQGVSSALYYLFAYTFMTIGAFAVLTVLGGEGDRHHDIADYRGLASRQPVLAFALVVLLIAQAGVPFTTGFLTKFQVVQASVDAGSVPLAVIAMVSATVAGFFYLRWAVLMYTPARLAGTVPGVEPLLAEGSATANGNGSHPGWQSGNGLGAVDGAEATLGNGRAEALLSAFAGPKEWGNDVPGLGTVPAEPVTPAGPGALPVWSGTERVTATQSRINAEVLLDTVEGPVTRPAEVLATRPAEGAAPVARKVPVPPAATLAIGLCVAVTVVFGIIPGPLVDFAHQATLLFFP